MICKSLKTKLLYNYRFTNKSVEISDDENFVVEISYTDWCKNFYIIDKWRNLSKSDKKYNEEIKNK